MQIVLAPGDVLHGRDQRILRYKQESIYMISVVLRVHNDNLDIQNFINKHELDPDAVFDHSFNQCLFDKDTLSKDEFIKCLVDAIEDYDDVLAELRERGINSEIDIGVTAGADYHFTCSLALPSELIKKISKYNIDIVFSAYPASE